MSEIDSGPKRRASEFWADVLSRSRVSEDPLLKQFRQATHPSVAPLRKLPPKILYHYTTASGFVGIVSEQCLHATNFRYLNDPSEVKYGRDLIHSVVEAHRGTSNILNERFFDSVLTAFSILVFIEVNVACFTSLEDDLSQWRAYGHPSPERYALGFDFKAIETLVAEDPFSSFDQVEYDPAIQQNRVEDFLNRCLEFLEMNEISPSQIDLLAAAATGYLAAIMPLFKNPAYEREEEWRIIVNTPWPSHPLEFDTTRGVVRPYVRFPLRRLSLETSNPASFPLKTLHVLAPTRSEIALKAASMVVEEKRLLVAIKPSGIPFAD